MLNASTLVNHAIAPATWQRLLAFHDLLATDDYVRYVDAYYREAVRRFGERWFYLDIVNTLYAAADLLQPRRYLEIGVRRGRSVATVARACPSVDIVAFDMWMQDYAGMENPGPDHVRRELARMGHRGQVVFVDGDSHQTVPAHFAAHPEAMFDLITVDGDHSLEGALADLRTVVPRLAVGGVLVFDDIAHPQHPYLLDVWLQLMQENPQLGHYAFAESGFGVAFAIRTR
jgi:predicted O-methyltransferase YrrM